MNITIVSGYLNKLTALMSGEKKPYIYGTIASRKDFVPKGSNKKNEFIPFVAFGNTAEFLGKNFTVGSGIATHGRIIMGQNFKLTYCVEKAEFTHGTSAKLDDPPTIMDTLSEEEDVIFGADLTDDEMPF